MKTAVFWQTSRFNPEQGGGRSPPQTLVPIHPTIRLHIQEDSNFQRPEWFVQLLRLEFKITWTQAKTCFLCLLPRQGFGWQWGPWSFECPSVRTVSRSEQFPQKKCTKTRAHTHTNTGILAQHSNTCYGVWISNHYGNFSGQSAVRLLYQILTAGNGFITAQWHTA
jgi:hypothetical protein